MISQRMPVDYGEGGKLLQRTDKTLCAAKSNWEMLKMLASALDGLANAGRRYAAVCIAFPFGLQELSGPGLRWSQSGKPR